MTQFTLPGQSTPGNRKPHKLLLLGIAVIGFGLFAPKLISSGQNPPTSTNTPAIVEDSGTEVAAATPASTPSPLGLLLKLTIGVALVGGVVYAVARAVRPKAALPSRNMQLLASLSVDPRCVIHLVRAGERRLLVGIDHTGVRTLTELPET